MEERFFILTPTPTDEKKKSAIGDTFPVYHDAEGKPMMWSGDFPIPAVDTRVFVNMNRIGWATVKGFFESAGFVGLMCLPDKLPENLAKQVERDAKKPDTPKWAKEGIGCFFGNELRLSQPKK